MPDQRTMTATWVVDILNPATRETLSFHRCDECRAMVLSEDAEKHLRWHGLIMYAVRP